jgi:hypothetical protein
MSLKDEQRRHRQDLEQARPDALLPIPHLDFFSRRLIDTLIDDPPADPDTVVLLEEMGRVESPRQEGGLPRGRLEGSR